MNLECTLLIDWWWLLPPLLGFVWAPKSWSPGELVTAASMNTNIRDHLNEGLRTQTTSLTGAQNNFTLDGPFSYVKCTNTSALILTGALIDSGNVDGARVIVEALDGDVTFKNQNTSSATANRFITPHAGDVDLRKDQRALLVYDTGNTRWRVNNLGERLALLGVGLLVGAANSGSAETDLTGYEFAIPASFFSDGESLELVGSASLAANGNTKTLRFYIGATNFGIIYSGTDNAKVLHFRMVLTRRTSSAMVMTGTAAVYTAGGTAVITGVDEGITSLNFPVIQTAKLTGQGGVSNDIKMTDYSVRHWRGNGSIV